MAAFQIIQRPDHRDFVHLILVGESANGRQFVSLPGSAVVDQLFQNFDQMHEFMLQRRTPCLLP